MNWKDVKGYEGLYRVSDAGDVYSTRAGRNLKQTPNGKQGNQYLKVALCDGGQKTKMVSHLVAEAFLGERPEGCFVCHGPNGCFDNSLPNLYYATHAENQNDRWRDGTRLNMPVGCSNGKEYVSMLEAAKDTGSNHGNVSRVCNGGANTTNGLVFWFLEEIKV